MKYCVILRFPSDILVLLYFGMTEMLGSRIEMGTKFCANYWQPVNWGVFDKTNNFKLFYYKRN